MLSVFDFWVFSLLLSIYFVEWSITCIIYVIILYLVLYIFCWVVYSLHYLCYNIIFGVDNSAICFDYRDFWVLTVVFMCCRLCEFEYLLFYWKLKIYCWKHCSKIFFIATKYYLHIFITWLVHEQCHETSKKNRKLHKYGRSRYPNAPSTMV